MMFEIEIPRKEYQKWNVFDIWMDQSNQTLIEILVACPEVEWVSLAGYGETRLFRFVSEEHYNWFLLKQ